MSFRISNNVHTSPLTRPITIYYACSQTRFNMLYLHFRGNRMNIRTDAIVREIKIKFKLKL